MTNFFALSGFNMFLSVTSFFRDHPALLFLLILVLITVVVIQIGKITEFTGKIRGEEETQLRINKRQSVYMFIFLIVFLIGVIGSAIYYKNYMLGFGPHASASEHGGSLDFIFKLTLIVTGMVFLVTQVLLFWFAFKYRAKKDSKATYMPHDTRLEIIWTAIPAVTMALLVFAGLDAWNDVMADVSSDEEFIEFEATGSQFKWELRYPGPDGNLGKKDFKLIQPGKNPLGQDWTDEANLDDIHVSEIVLPKGKKVRVRINSKDVLHNFFLPHFRLKMDAVPGMPTYFVFTPSKTTVEYRSELKNYPEYQKPDPNNPDKKLWETFNYELACAELCGSGHYSMQKLVKIVEQDEYEEWLATQKSYYFSQVRFKDHDPFKDKLFDFEEKERAAEFNERVAMAMDSTDKTVLFKYVYFDLGKSTLKAISHYELDDLVEVLNKYPKMTIEVSGHTDDTGTPEINQNMSEERAKVVYDYLIEKGIADNRLRSAGYGQDRPIATNDTEAGRAQNRRTEFRILTQ